MPFPRSSAAKHSGLKERLKRRRRVELMHVFFKKREWQIQVFLRSFRDPSWVLRIVTRVPRIRGNDHRVPRVRENRVPKFREIGSLQVHTGYLTFSFKKIRQINCTQSF